MYADKKNELRLECQSVIKTTKTLLTCNHDIVSIINTKILNIESKYHYFDFQQLGLYTKF